MENKEIKRRISLEDDFMNHISNDLLYAYMLTQATFNPKEKKIYLTKYKYVKDGIANVIAKVCGKSKKTIDRHLAVLIERGLVAVSSMKLNDEETVVYTFPYDYDGLYQLVDNDMLKYLVHTRNQCAVRIYVYLLNKYQYKNDYHFTAKELQVAIGYSPNTEQVAVYALINDILTSFKREGVIEYDEVYEPIVEKRTSKVINTPNKVLRFVASRQAEIRSR